MRARPRLHGPLLALLVVAAACSTSAPTLSPPSAAPPPPSPETPSPIPTGKGSAAEALARLCERPAPGPSESIEPDGPTPAAIEEVQRQVEQLRGLRFVDPVAAEPLTQPELVERLMGAIDRSYPKDLYARKSLAWQTIGVIPDGSSIRDALLEYASGQVIGFYVPTTGELVFIGSEDPSPLERVTLAHELTHAIDDQHFHLERLDQLESECADEALAAAIATVEGSAQFFSFAFARTFLTLDEQLGLAGGSDSTLEGVPPFIVRMQTWPYIEGLEFISAIEAEGGTRAIDTALERLPQSTEQILHPERYPNDAPQPVDVSNLAPVLGKRWQDLDVQEVGEEWLSIMLGLRLDASTAGAATEGWDGGTYRAWSNADRVAVVLSTVWDREADAQEFADAMEEWLRASDQIAAIFPAAGRRSVQVAFATDRAALDALGVAV
jgi:hypothetical protein